MKNEQLTMSYDKFIHPDLEQLTKIDEFLKSTNQKGIRHKDGSISLICPDLDLSDITK